MELHVAAWILINWLLAAAWIINPVYSLWACLVVILWWIAWYRRSPPWPAPSRRVLVYGFFLLTIAGFVVIIGRWQAFLVVFVILAVWILESRLRRRRATR